MASFAPAPSGDVRGTGGDDRAAVQRPRETIGDLLRRTRIEYGAEIDTIAASLRIRASYLSAIEQARYDRLPGSVYALGFVRAYATHLGLDGEEAVRRFKQEGPGLDKRRDLSFPVPLTPRSVPGGRMLLAAFVLAVCAYGIWHYLSTGDRDRPERVAAVPSALLPPAPAPALASAPPAAAATPSAPVVPPAPGADQVASPSASAAGSTAAPAAVAAPPAAASQPSTASPPSPSPLPADSLNTLSPRAGPDSAPAKVTVAELPPPAAAPSVPVAPPPAASAAPAGATPVPGVPAAAPVAPPTASPPPAAPAVALASPTPALAPAPLLNSGGGRVFGAVDGPSHITLRAIQDCWIMVRDSDGAQTVVAQRTLHAGDSYRVPDRSGLLLRTGNAAGLEVLVDGKVAPVLGGTVRNVALDPTRLLGGTARLE